MGGMAGDIYGSMAEGVSRSPTSAGAKSTRSAIDCPKFRLKSPNFIYKSSKIV